MDAITGGRAQILGNFTEEEAKSIAKGIPSQGAFAQSVDKSLVPSDSEIRRILVERVGDQNQSIGIVVGVIEPSGRRIVAYGSFSKSDKRSVDGNTVFEIGSITKVFTSLLLADMVQAGEVALSDPASKYLPKGVNDARTRRPHHHLEDLATASIRSAQIADKSQ